MTIDVTFYPSSAPPYYRADCRELPCTPPVGEGRSVDEAVGCLFRRLAAEGGWLDRFLGLTLTITVTAKAPDKEIP